MEYCTVLVIIKLTKNPVSLQFRCGSCKLKLCRYFTMFSDILRMLYIVWSQSPKKKKSPNYVQRF